MKFYVLVNDNVKEFPRGRHALEEIRIQVNAILPTLEKYEIVPEDPRAPFIPSSIGEKKYGPFVAKKEINPDELASELIKQGFRLEQFSDRDDALYYWSTGTI